MLNQQWEKVLINNKVVNPKKKQPKPIKSDEKKNTHEAQHILKRTLRQFGLQQYLRVLYNNPEIL